MTSRRFAIMQVVMLALNVLFLFGQPLWSWLLNDVAGFITTLCDTPAEHITCGDGSNYTETAVRLGRMRDNVHIGCSCEQGILQDWACAANVETFSVSYFISTAPGTGLMAALSAWPILAAWFLGFGNASFVEDVKRGRCVRGATSLEVGAVAVGVAKYSQVTFQLFYGLFLINTLCIVPEAHKIVVIVFIVSIVVHWITLAWAIGFSTKRGKLIVTLAGFGAVGLLVGMIFPSGPSWLGQHAFWLGECTGLSCGFSIGPILSLEIAEDACASKPVANAQQVPCTILTDGPEGKSAGGSSKAGGAVV